MEKILLKFIIYSSFHRDVNVLIQIWIHNQRKAKIVKRHHHCNGITQIFIYLQWRLNHRDMFECIMRAIAHMRDKGHYARKLNKNKKKMRNFFMNTLALKKEIPTIPVTQFENLIFRQILI